MEKEKESWVLGIIGLIFLVFTLILFGLYFKYVSIGEWIAQENYVDKGEHFKQIGLFLATMCGFSWFIGVGFDLFERLPSYHKKKKRKRRVTCQKTNKVTN